MDVCGWVWGCGCVGGSVCEHGEREADLSLLRVCGSDAQLAPVICDGESPAAGCVSMTARSMSGPCESERG